jgi:hypothetical protein
MPWSKKGGASHASMDGGERERAVAATLNLGEMEMNGRE